MSGPKVVTAEAQESQRTTNQHVVDELEEVSVPVKQKVGDGLLNKNDMLL